MSVAQAGCLGSKSEDELEEHDLGRKLMISGAKFDGFCGWKVEKSGEKLDLLKAQRIHGSKSTKHNQTNKSQKNWGLFLVGIFEFRTKSSKRRLENGGRDSKYVINVSHYTI